MSYSSSLLDYMLVLKRTLQLSVLSTLPPTWSSAKAHFIGFSRTAPVAGVFIKQTLVFGLVMSDEALL